MIVFNMYAILVALFIALATLPVVLLYYFNVIGEEISLVISSWIALGVCLICRKNEIDGRLFWIPMWILAIPLVPFVTFAFYGWTGIITTVSIFVALFALIIFLAYYSEKRRANNITSENTDVAFDERNLLTSWKELQDKFFFPTFLRMTPEICAYNLKVAERIEPHNLGLASLPEFKDEMKYQAISIGSNVKINKAVVKKFNREIDERVENLQKEDKED